MEDEDEDEEDKQAREEAQARHPANCCADAKGSRFAEYPADPALDATALPLRARATRVRFPGAADGDALTWMTNKNEAYSATSSASISSTTPGTKQCSPYATIVIPVSGDMRIVILDSFAADQGDVDASGAGLRALGELAVHPRSADGRRRRARAGADGGADQQGRRSAPTTFAALPDLRYVGVLATGTNVVDLAAARAAGVAVTNVPGYAAESVAQLVFALDPALHARRRGPRRGGEGGRWAASPDFCFFTQPIARAGRQDAGGGRQRRHRRRRRPHRRGVRHADRARRRARDRRRAPGEPRMPLAEALPAADVVSLHCPLTEATRGMVDARFLAAMKPGAILINTARGAPGRRGGAGRGARGRPAGRRRARRAVRRAAARRSPADRSARAVGGARGGHAAHRLGDGRGAAAAGRRGDREPAARSSAARGATGVE